MGGRRLEEELNVVYAALNSAMNGVIITDKKGRIKYANPAFLRIFDYESEKEIIGKHGLFSLISLCVSLKLASTCQLVLTVGPLLFNYV